MLGLQKRVLPLERLEPPQLPDRSSHPLHARHPAPQHTVADLFPPARQHERVIIQRRRHRLYLRPRDATQLHGRQREPGAVPVHLLRPDRSPHPTPPSVSLARSVYFFE